MRLVSSARLGATFVLVVLGACSVPEKQQSSPDAGTDAPKDSQPPPSDAPPVDTDAPDTTMDEAPGMFSLSGQVVFRFSSNDPSASFMCRVDAEAASSCTSPYVRTLPDGPH
ncbi:MAG TPA: hypothetical protein VLM79_17825, partial [Kofleriaceae bacterium]|nr:hypothetical protein [Kofleriaceae bacterium]